MWSVKDFKTAGRRSTNVDIDRDHHKTIPRGSTNSDVEAAVLGADVSYRDENDVHTRPHAQPPETEQLANALPPQSEVESIHAKPSQSYAAPRRK